MDHPSISVIVPTKNRTSDLMVAVGSILPQLSISDEIIVIDQSETSCEIAIRELGIERSRLDNLFYVYCPNSVHSLVEAKQEGFRASTKDIVAFLEDDVEICPRYLDRIRLAFSSSSDLVGGCGAEVRPHVSRWYPFLFNLSHLGMFADKRVGISCQNGESCKMVSSVFLSGGISFFRREVIDKVGFDVSNDFFALEDIDFSLRVARLYGASAIGIFPNICLIHHRSPINRLHNFHRWKRKVKEFTVFYRKHHESLFDHIAYVWLLACLMVLSIAEALMSRDAKVVLGFFAGFFAGLRHELVIGK
jgi:GT2 family glycosyltransferase